MSEPTTISFACWMSAGSASYMGAFAPMAFGSLAELSEPPHDDRAPAPRATVAATAAQRLFIGFLMVVPSSGGVPWPGGSERFESQGGGGDGVLGERVGQHLDADAGAGGDGDVAVLELD